MIISQQLAGQLDVRHAEQQVAHLREQLGHRHQQAITAYSQKITALRRTLRQLDPQVILSRGYGLVRKGQQIVTTSQSVAIGDMITIELQDAAIESEVKNVHNK